jgi:hypothetical protein
MTTISYPDPDKNQNITAAFYDQAVSAEGIRCLPAGQAYRGIYLICQSKVSHVRY